MGLTGIRMGLTHLDDQEWRKREESGRPLPSGITRLMATVMMMIGGSGGDTSNQNILPMWTNETYRGQIGERDRFCAHLSSPSWFARAHIELISKHDGCLPDLLAPLSVNQTESRRNSIRMRTPHYHHHRRHTNGIRPMQTGTHSHTP